MNKFTILIFSLVLITVVAAIAIAAIYTQESDNTQDSDQMEWDQPTPLGKDVEMKIKQDYLDFHVKHINPDATADDVWLLGCCGIYDGCVAVMMDYSLSRYLTATGSETVGGVTFYYGNSNRILVWEDGNFHSLQEAYDAGLLTKDDLIKIERNYVAYSI
ncbi:MAG: hypothetical protein FWG96_06625 [Methanomassiliicoccaceae archaeon]|nr:hypothetical protein [Methanomassiliicoccaceae archaeon]